jgi:methyl-accepting chemotaxis protein
MSRNRHGFLAVWGAGLAQTALLVAMFFLPDWRVLAATVVLGLGLTAWAALSVDRPLRKALAAAEEFAANPDPEVLARAGVGGGIGGLLESLLTPLRKLREDAVFFGGAIRAATTPLLVCNRKDRIVFATPSLLDILRKPSTQVLGFSVSQAFYNRDGESITGKIMETGKAADTETELTLYDGRKVPIRLSANIIVNEQGETIGAYASFFDMSGRVQELRQVEEQRANMVHVGGEVAGLAERVASASEELSASADEQARGAQKQKAQTDSVATAMEEMTATVLEVAQNAAATSQAAEQARASAGQGVDMVGQAVRGINNVSESAGKLSEVLTQLDSQAAEIGRIINVINDIADQTNLLALNAAIEAARAGDAGRGFAVVADEVRKLAEKTMTATKEVEQAIGTIQQRSRHATESMAETARQVHESTDLSNKAGEALQAIMKSIEDMAMRVSQIAAAAEQQSSAAEEINRSIEDIALVAREADEGASQAAVATRDLAELAQELMTVATQFSGSGDGESKLRRSESEMKGVLPKITQEFVREKYGEAVFQAMHESMGRPVFLPTASYPDAVLHQMAELVSARTGVSTRNFFLDMGRHTIKAFHRMYGRYFKDEDLKTFYLRMNDLHAQLTKDQPGIKPPKFSYEDKGKTLFINYRSKRGLFDYFEGILNGAAEFKGEKVQLKVIPLDGETARAEITFLNGGSK